MHILNLGSLAAPLLKVYILNLGCPAAPWLKVYLLILGSLAGVAVPAWEWITT